MELGSEYVVYITIVLFELLSWFLFFVVSDVTPLLLYMLLGSALCCVKMKRIQMKIKHDTHGSGLSTKVR